MPVSSPPSRSDRLDRQPLGGPRGDRALRGSLLGLFLVVATTVGIVGTTYLNHGQARARDTARQELAAIADLKVQQIAEWRRERLADAGLVRGTPYGVLRALDVLEQPDSTRAQSAFTNWLGPYLASGHFERALLLATNLDLRLVHPADASRQVDETVRASAKLALNTPEITITDLHRSPDEDEVRLEFLWPIHDPRVSPSQLTSSPAPDAPTTPRVVGLLVLQVRAGDFLYPLIQRWPTASASGETVLARAEGNEVVYLNELRHRKGTAVKFRLPMDRAQLPAAVWLRGGREVEEGVDYRGVPVFTAVRAVPDTPWVMVAKVDKAELFAPLRREALAVGAAAAALLVAAALGVTVLWRRRTEQVLRDNLVAERERRTQAERFEALMKNANDAILLADEQDRVVEANDPALALYGYTWSELEGLPLVQLRAPDCRTEFARQSAALLQTGQAAFETRHVRKDGRTFPVEIRSRLVDFGGQRYKLGIIRDITERQVHEAALRESEQRFRLLLQRSPVAMRLVDRNETIAFLNDHFTQLFGYTTEDIPTLAEWWQQAYPDEEVRRSAMNGWAGALDPAAREEGFPAPREWNVRCRDGTVRVAQITSHAIGDGVLTCFVDLTERKAVEERLRNLARAVEQSPVAIVITDRAGRIEFANPRFTQVTGYTLEEVLGQNPRVLKSGQMPEDAYRHLWQTITSGNVWHGVFHNRRKDGSLFWETASISPIRDPAGEITHFVAVKEDVTEKRLMEAKLLRAQRVESIGNLASGIAHDLNNILTPIVMCSSLLQLEDRPDGRRELAQTIESSAQRAVAIVKQLLGFARGREGQRVSLQVRHLVRDMAAIARETFPRSIQIEESCAGDLWPVVADPTHLHQVLLNLCVNARDAMPSGGSLRLSADNVVLDDHFVAMNPQSHPGPHVRIRVADTGTGIAPAVQEHIFESFFTTKGESEGTGLGLTTVQGIVRDLGGFIGFTSQLNAGTTFEIHLPAAPDTPLASVPAAPDQSSQPHGHGELILVVDDEPAIRNATRHTLERHGYRALVAGDGIEALAHITDRQHEIRAVVTDVMMPLMDGVTFCRAVHRLNPQVALIVSSGGLFGPAGTKALQALEEIGVRHILHKPHNAEALLRTLAQALAPQPTAR